MLNGAQYDCRTSSSQIYIPWNPFKMKFITKVYHPNVSPTSGTICLCILKDGWSPVLSLRTTLISLQAYLHSPELSSLQNSEVAKYYMTSRSSFEDTARYWTHVYAGGPAPTSAIPGATIPGKATAAVRDEVAIAGLDRAHVDQFEAIGFERSKVVRTNTRDWRVIWFESHLTQIDVLRRLNYRGANVAKITDDKVVEELLKA